MHSYCVYESYGTEDGNATADGYRHNYEILHRL